MKKISLSIIALLLLLCSLGKSEENAPVQKPAAFAVQEIVTQDATVYQDFTANIEGLQNVTIRSKVSGFIQKIDLNKGKC